MFFSIIDLCPRPQSNIFFQLYIENHKGSKSLIEMTQIFFSYEPEHFHILLSNLKIKLSKLIKIKTAEQKKAKRENEFKTLGFTAEPFSVLKFSFSEKATKICAIVLMVLTFTK